jgi:hypothetical protein
MEDERLTKEANETEQKLESVIENPSKPVNVGGNSSNLSTSAAIAAIEAAAARAAAAGVADHEAAKLLKGKVDQHPELYGKSDPSHDPWFTEVTTGEFWEGPQIEPFSYTLMVTLGGFFALDHLYLRSPRTFLYKLILNVFTGIWYFYDVAQVFGEWDNIKTNGIGIPGYGPVGIGKGIFIVKDKDGNPLKNRNGLEITPSKAKGLTPGWFVVFALVTIFFFPFGLNKAVLGDTTGAIVHFILGIFIIGIFLGFKDLYKLFGDTRSLFNKTDADDENPYTGSTRFLGPFDIGWKKNYAGLGPLPVRKNIVQSGGGIIQQGGGNIPKRGGAPITGKPVKATESKLKHTEEAAASEVASTPPDASSSKDPPITEDALTPSSTVKKNIFEFVIGKTPVFNLASIGLNGLGIANGRTLELVNAAKAAEANAKAELAQAQTDKVKAEIAAVQTQAIKQTGGARLEDESSISSSALLFCMGLISAGGYVFYSLRNYSLLSRNDGKNDTPRYASAI